MKEVGDVDTLSENYYYLTPPRKSVGFGIFATLKHPGCRAVRQTSLPRHGETRDALTQKKETFEGYDGA